MTRTRTLIRRATLTTALVGAVAFGSVGLAPAAYADEEDRSTVSVDYDDGGDDTDGGDKDGDKDGKEAEDKVVDGGYTVTDKKNGNGPVAFLITEKGRKPVFFCDADKPKKRHKICQADPNSGQGRF